MIVHSGIKTILKSHRLHILQGPSPYISVQSRGDFWPPDVVGSGRISDAEVAAGAGGGKVLDLLIAESSPVRFQQLAAVSFSASSRFRDERRDKKTNASPNPLPHLE